MPPFRPPFSFNTIKSRLHIRFNTTKSSTTPNSTTPPKNPIFGHPFRTLIATAKLVAFTHLFIQYGFYTSPAAGPSMLPTMEVLGEWMLVSKWHRFGRGVSVGDVVVFNIPINDGHGVKRVLGLPGDYVLVNTPHSSASSLEEGVTEENRGEKAMMQIPKGHCWLVGDNMEASRDSRLYGPVPLALIRGKVVAKVRQHPWEFQWLRNPLDTLPEYSLEG
ncbi:peptidase S24/S26A/S26B/S26C [Bombardia bombarda]|uniref:Mitochondrial inner membrane protease subunit n=1 Tax=Bombardia bombarda TaxID=252184 RepID=A0AA40CFH2_9PEZI|nr:peptidase S24/S26A/S26B/S26C [Bombardia bombarda]